MASRLPMFPLGTVLVPSAPLPLHIFEPRYRQLMADCLEGEAEFGVVLIERGFEVGGHDERFDLGTVARIREAGQLEDGRWVLIAEGTRRVRVAEWLPDDPYPLAMVDDLAEQPWRDADQATRQRAETQVRRTLAMLAELGQPADPATFALAENPVRAAWQLVAVAPLGPLDKQRLLEVDDHGERLAALAALAEEEATVLAYRLSGA
jgi:Lon protease-like protein